MSENESKKRNVVVFACNECGQGAMNTAGVARIGYDTAIKIVPLQCSGQANPVLILEALKDGADAVGVVGCCIGACHFVNGNMLSMHRIKLMKKLFKELGYSDQQINHYTARAAEGETAVGDFEDIMVRLKRAEKEGNTLPGGW